MRGVCSFYFSLFLPLKSIKSTRILNPIELGKSFDEKTFVLDVKDLLNDASVINLDFSPFPGYPEFYAMNKMMNVKKHYIYNDNFTLNVLDLSQIELATDEDKAYKMDYWAKLFKAKTWEYKSLEVIKNVSTEKRYF